MDKLEKIMLTSAAIGTALSVGITATTVKNLFNEPEAIIRGKEIASLMVKCYSPMFIGIVPMIYWASKEVYKDIKSRLKY